MFNIQATNKYLNLKGSNRLYYVLGAGGVIVLITGFFYKDILVTLTMIAATITAYFLLSKAPDRFTLEIDEEGFKTNEEKIAWVKCISWAIVDLGDVMEFMIQTNSLIRPFHYFYVDEDDKEIKRLIALLSEYLAYDEEVVKLNTIHNWLRTVGLK